MATDLTVANTILKQLGGVRFRLMTGSKNFVGGDSDLSFKVGSNPKHVTHVKITLDRASDSYTMTFMKIRNFNVKVVATHTDVYFDQLQPIFTQETGLYTKL